MTNLAPRGIHDAAVKLRLGRISPMMIAAIIVAAVAALPLLSQFTVPLSTPDEGLLITYPEQIMSGRWPNRDFFATYGPGGFALLAGAFKVAGLSVVVERMLGLSYHLLVAIGVVMLMRGRGALTAGVAGVISALLLTGLGLPAYAWLGATACLVWSVALLQGEPSKVQVGLAGIFASLSIAWRPDIAPAALFVSVVLTANSPRWRPWLVGSILGFIPLAAHGAMSGWNVYRDLVSTRVLSNASPSFLSLTPMLTIGVGVILGCVVVLGVSVVRAVSRFSVAIFGMAVLLLPQALQRVDKAHILFVGCFLVPLAVVDALPPARVWQSFVHRYGRSFSVAVSWSALTVLVVSLVTQGLVTNRQDPTAWLTHGSRRLPVAGVAHRDDLELLIRAANRQLRPGGKVFIGATDMAVPNFSEIALYYMLPEYVPSSYFLESVPGPATGGRLAADIGRADVLFLSKVPELERKKVWPDAKRGSEAANEVVARQFCLAKQAGHTLLFFKCQG